MRTSRQEEYENMACCEICLVKFSMWKRKRECFECQGECCSSCLVKEQGKRTCKRCRILLAIPPDPSALMSLRVKDLKQFLLRKHVSHQGCTQKDELVQLVLQMAVTAHRARASPAPSSTSSSYSSGSRAGSERAPSSSPLRVPTGASAHTTVPETNAEPVSSTTASFVSNPPSSLPSSPNLNTNNGQPLTEQKVEDTLASLENLCSEEAIEKLNVRQLKLLLLRHFVDYRGCCEKAELQDRVRRLWRQRKETVDTDPDTIPNEQLCKICWEVPINCVLLECGHMATCTECGKRMHECPICRQYVVRVVHTFRA